MPTVNALVADIHVALAFDGTISSFADMLALYENTVSAYHGLTSSIAGEPNFPGFTWAAHGIAPNAPQAAITAMRTAAQRVDVWLLLDYSQVPDSSGWTSRLNFVPAQAERAALQAAGNRAREYERQHPLLVPAGTPNFTAFPRSTPAPDAIDFPAEFASWQATMDAYAWIDAYDPTDNDAFPHSGTDAQQYAYLVQLQLRFSLYIDYAMAVDEALRSHEAVFNYLQTQWWNYQNDPIYRNAFISAMRRYFALDGAPAPNGLAEMIAEQQSTLRNMAIAQRYGAFFNGYRMGLSVADFARYSNAQLREELAAAQSQLERFSREFPSETVPTAWENYPQTLLDVMRFRLFDGITNHNTYDFDNLYFLPMFEQYRTNPQIMAALQELAIRRRDAVTHTNLSDALLQGNVAPWFDNWLPTRGLRDPIALDPEDTYRAQYEHVLHTIAQLDVLLNSTWLANLMRNSQCAMRNFPAIELPELDMSFLAQLGEMNIDLASQRANDVLGLPHIRRHIEADRGHVFLYILREMFNQEVGLDFVVWLVQELLEAEEIDLTPAAEPFFATFINNLVHENISDALPNAILDLHRSVANTVNTFLTTPLLSLTNDTSFAQLGSIDLTLGYMLGETAGQHPQSLTLGCLFNNPRLRDALGFEADSWLDLLGLEPPPQGDVNFNLADIECPDERRTAFSDAMTESLTGLAPFLRLMFGSNGMSHEDMDGEEFDSWEMDLVVGMRGVTQPINDIINDNPLVRAFNSLRGVFGLDPVVANITLPDVSLSRSVRPGGTIDPMHLSNTPHWSGEYDSRRGLETELSAANLYGNFILPLFEQLGMDEHILHSEAEFNSAMRNATDAQIPQLLVQSIVEPLLNWLPTLGSLTSLLDFLPNYALATQLLESETNMLSALQIQGTVYLAGARGDGVQQLIASPSPANTGTLTYYLRTQLFDPSFFGALFAMVLPDLVSFPGVDIFASFGLSSLILAEPMIQIARLYSQEPNAFAGTFLNRGTDNHVTILDGRASNEPDWDIVRPATLGSLAGFFGGDPRAFTVDFAFDLGEQLTTQLPLLDHFSAAFSSLLTQPESDFTPDEPLQTIFAGIMANPHHSIAWLVELFNMQRYPARDFMRYTWVEHAQARNPVHNPVRYSEVWTRQMADQMSHRLPEFLDNFSDLFFDEPSFLAWLNLPEVDREAILESVMERLEPHIPMLRVMLLEDDLLLMGDLIGFSGYDGYRHGVIPILEAFGVPQRYILPHDEFVQLADTDEQFIRLIFDPLLDVLERTLADPIHELPRVLPNIIYFISAEEPDRPSNLVTAVNRMLRPLYAIADMLTPMTDIEDIFVLLGIEYPFIIDIAGVTQELRLPIEPALNTIFTNMLRNWFGDFTEEIGLSLELEDLLDLVTGTLSIFRSVNGQNDAVRLETDLPDTFTHLARQLIPMILSDENWAEMRLLIAARLPANTRDRALNLLDGLAELLRDTDDDSGPDLVLAVLFYVFTGADCIMEHLLTLRRFYRQIQAFFNNLLQNDTFWIVALTALGALATVGTVNFFRVLAHNVRYRRNNQRDVLAAYDDVGIPQTGDSNVIFIIAASIGVMAIAGALLLLKKPKQCAIRNA